MAANLRLTPEQGRELARRYNDGDKVREIAADYGIRKLRTVGAIAVRYGSTRRPIGRPAIRAEFHAFVEDILK